MFLAEPVSDVLYSFNPNTGLYKDEAGCVPATCVCVAVVAPYKDEDAPHKDVEPVVAGFRIMEVIVDAVGLKSLYHFIPIVAPEPPSSTINNLFNRDAATDSPKFTHTVSNELV